MTSADLIWLTRPVRVPLAQERCGARHVRRGHARAVELTPAAVAGRHGGEDRDPGGGHVRLQAQGVGRRARGREARDRALLRRRCRRDRLRRRPGRIDRAEPERVEVVARRDHRDDAVVRRAVDRLDDDVACRRDLRLAEREVDHVHPVFDCGLDPGDDLRRVAVEPELPGRDRQHPVVAQVRGRSDSRDAHGASGPWRRGAVVAGRDPCDVRAVLRLDGIEGQLAVAVLQSRRRERAGDDHLRGRVRRVPLREARRKRVAGGREEPVRLVDPVVDDPDLDALPRGREIRAPDLRGADHERAPEERAVVANARVDAGHARQTSETLLGGGRDEQREAVEDEAVAPADACLRDRAAQRSEEVCLRDRALQRDHDLDARRP